MYKIFNSSCLLTLPRYDLLFGLGRHAGDEHQCGDGRTGRHGHEVVEVEAALLSVHKTAGGLVAEQMG